MQEKLLSLCVSLIVSQKVSKRQNSTILHNYRHYYREGYKENTANRSAFFLQMYDQWTFSHRVNRSFTRERNSYFCQTKRRERQDGWDIPCRAGKNSTAHVTSPRFIVRRAFGTIFIRPVSLKNCASWRHARTRERVVERKRRLRW